VQDSLQIGTAQVHFSSAAIEKRTDRRIRDSPCDGGLLRVQDLGQLCAVEQPGDGSEHHENHGGHWDHWAAGGGERRWV